MEKVNETEIATAEKLIVLMEESQRVLNEVASLSMVRIRLDLQIQEVKKTSLSKVEAYIALKKEMNETTEQLGIRPGESWEIIDGQCKKVEKNG